MNARKDRGGRIYRKILRVNVPFTRRRSVTLAEHLETSDIFLEIIYLRRRKQNLISITRLYTANVSAKTYSSSLSIHIHSDHTTIPHALHLFLFSSIPNNRNVIPMCLFYFGFYLFLYVSPCSFVFPSYRYIIVFVLVTSIPVLAFLYISFVRSRLIKQYNYL